MKHNPLQQTYFNEVKASNINQLRGWNGKKHWGKQLHYAILLDDNKIKRYVVWNRKFNAKSLFVLNINVKYTI